MLQRGLLTVSEKQQQQQQKQLQQPYDMTRATTIKTTAHEANLLKEQERLSAKSSSSRQDLNDNCKERINCLPIIELPQIKIEQDVEYMEGIEEQQEPEKEWAQEDKEKQKQNMEVDQQEELIIKPVPQLLEPTSILKTSLLTGAANTLATLTAAAEQIARMPNEGLTKNYAYLKEENKRTYTTEEPNEKPETAEEKRTCTPTTTTTYTSILQTALMSKRPATLNVAASSSTASASLPSGILGSTKALHVRTPDQVLKTAVTLATLGEIAAEQEQQQLQQQQQMHQQPHILVVPQVQRKMCTLPFKKLNFANVTSSSSILPSATSTAIASNTASSNCTTSIATSTAAATTTTITNNYLGSNLKANTNLTNSSCILNTNNLAASTSNSRELLETNTVKFFNTNTIINNVTISSSSNNNNNNSDNNTNLKSQTMATQTLKIPIVKPHLVTTQTQTEETSSTQTATAAAVATTTTLITPLTFATTLTNNSASSLQTASSGSSSSGLLRTAVPTTTKMLAQNSSLNSLSNKFLTKSNKLEANKNMASLPAAATNVAADNVVGNIFKHVSNTNTNTTLAKMNVIQNNAADKTSASVVASETASRSTNTATNVTVVVFETLLPED